MGLCAAKISQEELKSLEVERAMEEDMMRELEKIKLLLLGMFYCLNFFKSLSLSLIITPVSSFFLFSSSPFFLPPPPPLLSPLSFPHLPKRRSELASV